jgi:hypothetical protein
MRRIVNSIAAGANHSGATQRNINNDKKGQERRDMLYTIRFTCTTQDLWLFHNSM